MNPAPPTPPPRRSGFLPTILAYTRGLILNQHLRRVTMFYTIIVPMFMVFFWTEFLQEWLDPRQHFYRFAVYWMVCGWLTILAALLAVYDILITRLKAQAMQRALRAKMLGKEALEKERER